MFIWNQERESVHEYFALFCLEHIKNIAKAFQTSATMTCSICHETYSPFSLRKFHSFPTDVERLQKWFDRIGYAISNYKKAQICSDHFIQNDYYYTGTAVHNIRLKKTAIPSVLIQKNEKKDSGSCVQNDYQQSISCESTIAVEYRFKTDQQPTSSNQYNNIILADSEPTLAKENGTSQNKKRCNNDMKKIFVKNGKYNTECMRKTDFTTDRAWMTFLKYVKYQRYLLKRSVIQKSQAQKQIITLQSVIKTLRSKNLIT